MIFDSPFMDEDKVSRGKSIMVSLSIPQQTKSFLILNYLIVNDLVMLTDGLIFNVNTAIQWKNIMFDTARVQVR